MIIKKGTVVFERRSWMLQTLAMTKMYAVD